MTHPAIQSFFIQGPAGRLEALLNSGQPDASCSALLCHPHPLYGGTMHNKVVFQAMKALNGFGLPVLRFNFRGAGMSAGTHDAGHGEMDDVRAGLDWLEAEFAKPIIFAGFSFGAAVGQKVACSDPRVLAVISLGTPVSAEGRNYRYTHLADCTKPKLFVSGDRDQYGAANRLKEIVDDAAAPKELVLVPDADHFFDGHLPQMKSAIEQWLEKTFGSRAEG